MSYQRSGRLSVFGILPAEQKLRAHAPMSEIREGHDGTLADAEQLLEHVARRVGRLDGLAQDRIVEGEVRVVDEVGVGVALDHRQALRHAVVHPGLGELDAARVDAPLLGEHAEQRAVAAADIEHARVRA